MVLTSLPFCILLFGNPSLEWVSIQDLITRISGLVMLSMVGAMTAVVVGFVPGLVSALAILGLQKIDRALTLPEAVAVGAVVCAATALLVQLPRLPGGIGWPLPLIAAALGVAAALLASFTAVKLRIALTES